MNSFLFLSLGLALGALLVYLWMALREGRRSAQRQNRLQLAEGRAAQLAESLETLKSEAAQYRQRADAQAERRAAAEARADSLAKRVEEFRDEREEAKRGLKEAAESLAGLQKALAVAQAEKRSLQDRLQAQAEEVEATRKRLEAEFERTAAKLFEEKSRRFAEDSKERIGALLSPLGERMKAFQEKVEQSRHEAGQQQAALLERIAHLQESSARVSEEANNLASALKGEKTKKAQGDWGEMILESVLERSGLRKGEEYLTQASYTDERGRRKRPDAVVRFPGGRKVVIDAKVSLAAYERFNAAEAEDEQARELDALARDLRARIDELSGKEYPALPDLRTPDYAMLFVPVEPAYLLALRHDAELLPYAFGKNVILVSPTHLVAVLRVVEMIWRQDRQHRNAEEIAKAGGQLVDAFVTLAGEFGEVGEHLEKAQASFEKAAKRLAEGGRTSILKRVRRLEELGAKDKGKRLEEVKAKGLPPSVSEAFREPGEG